MALPKAFWLKLKSEYKRGEGSLRELAKKHGVDPGAVMKRSAREKWSVERARVVSAAEAKNEIADIDELSEMLGRHRRLAAKLLAKAEGSLDAIDLFDPTGLSQVAQAIKSGIHDERLSAGVDPTAPPDGAAKREQTSEIVISWGGRRDTEEPEAAGE